MKTIGLIGGFSWESTMEYLKIMNESVRTTLGGNHSARLLAYTFDFEEIERLQCENRWTELSDLLINAAKVLENGGADLLIICANTMHKVAEEVSAATDIPLLHMGDVTAEKILDGDMKKVGLLGTIYTMEQDFYKGRLASKYGLEVIVPEESDRKLVNEIIYNELCSGIVNEESQEVFRRIISILVEEGAEGIILGCTEIPMLVRQEDSPVPLFNTTRIHAQRAVEIALEDVIQGGQ
jgi:aspartate racemase